MRANVRISPIVPEQNLQESARNLQAARGEPTTARHKPFFVQRARATRGVGPTRCHEMKLVFVSRGETEIFHSEGTVALSQGKMALLPADQTYWGVPSIFVETIAVYVRPDFAEHQLRWLPHSAQFLESLFASSTPQPVDYTPAQSAELRVHLLALAQVQAASGNELRQMGHLANVFALLQPVSEGHDRYGHHRTELLDAIRYLEDDLAIRWTVGSLAKIVSLSPSQLTRLFVSQTGIPPSQYLCEARALHMHHLLLQGNVN